MSNYYEKIKKGLTTSLTVAAGAVSRAAEVAKDLAEDVLTLKCLKDYKLAGHVATAGPGNSWKIFAAVSKKPGAVFPEASVWILDKKGLTDQASRAGRARGFDHFFELQRRSCVQLVKIKHPGVVKIIEPLEETSGQMVFVTEPVFGSLSNLLSQFRDVPTAPEDRTSAALSPLEIKYGLCHISDTLQFLHQEARLAHCNLSLGSVIVTRDGGWKLAGFEFSGTIAEFGGTSSAAITYEYTSAHPSPWEEYSVPSLPYTAPELVGGCLASSDVTLSGAADCFSLAALTYELLTGKQLLHVGSSTGEYRSRLSMLSSTDISGVAGSLQPLLRAMLSTSASARPNAAAFAGCQWFSEDMLLRCLKFLDSILQRDIGQKVAFLKDLMTFWHQFDDRLLQHRVLPPIVQEMRSDVVALAALPVVLAIMGRMKPEGFAASGILPVLKPIFEHADGEVLLALVKHLNVFYSLMPSDAHAGVLVPLMLRAFDSNNTRAQEETLKALQRLAPDMPYSLLRESLMPRVVGLCLRTTSLVVRTGALALMAQAAHRLDKEAAAAMLDVCSQIVAVDKSTGTAMAVLRLGDAIGKHYGPEITCQKVLPLLCPLLVSPGLNPQTFSNYINVIRSLVDGVAEKTGSTLAAAAEAAGTATAAKATAAHNSISTVFDSTTDVNVSGLGGTRRSSSDWQQNLSRGDSSKSASTAAVWDTPLTSSSSSSTPKSSTPVYSSSSMAAAAPSWSSAAWTSSSAGSQSQINLQQPSWQQQQQQPGWQQQQRTQGYGSSSMGMPAPDIFSRDTGSGDMPTALSIGRQQQQQQQFTSGSRIDSGSNAIGNASRASGMSDLFGGLAVTQPGNNTSTQAVQQPRSPMALAPPPASKGIKVSASQSTSRGFSSVSHNKGGSTDPFAGLVAPANTSNRAVAAAPAQSHTAGFDPFSSLAAGKAAASSTDPFAGLSTSSSAAGRPEQQQQQRQQATSGVDLLL